MRFSTRPCPAQGARARSTTLLYVAAGLGLAALSISADSVAQDAATPDTAALDSTPSEPLSDRERRRQVRRQADAQAKAVKAEASAKAKADAQAKSGQKADPNDPNTLVFYVEDPKVVCRNIEVIGSKISRRVCGTQEQWDALKRKGEDDMRQMGRSLNGSTAGAPQGTATAAGVGVPP
jgi:hypothetical protein